MKRLRVLALAAVVLILLAVATARLDAGPEVPAAQGSPAAMLAELDVEPEAGAGYDRDLFGDYDRPGQLAANWHNWPACDGYYSAADAVCHVSPEAVEVDHRVALAEAWDSGASTWGRAQLDQFAEGADNLWLMTGDLNGAKSDQDPAEWLPPVEGAWCGYVDAWITTKWIYRLSVDRAERDALAGVLADCPEDGGS